MPDWIHLSLSPFRIMGKRHINNPLPTPCPHPTSTTPIWRSSWGFGIGSVVSANAGWLTWSSPTEVQPSWPPSPAVTRYASYGLSITHNLQGPFNEGLMGVSDEPFCSHQSHEMPHFTRQLARPR